ncbi:unnamed protein product, partial [Brenthis ino]
MPATLVDLRPDRRLLDHEFEGYKLNLQNLPHFCHKLPSPISGIINTTIIISITNSKKPGDFNLCLTFPSDHIAVVSDGTGYLHIIDTGIRNRPASDKQTWQTLYSSLALGDVKKFIMIDIKMQERDNIEILHCLLQSIEQSEKHFNSVLTWVSYGNDGQTWKELSVKQVKGKGIVHYAALETSCSALYVASDNLFKFTSDSEKDIVIKSVEEPRQIIYTWLQTNDDISITLKLQNNFDKKLLFVNVTPLSVKISYGGKEFVQGRLKHKVDSELTTWHIQDSGQVDVLITKSESLIWDELIEGGDKNGEQILDASLVDEVHKRLAHLCSETEVRETQTIPGLNTQELEECDAVSEEDTVLVRMDITNHEITHRVPLSVHQYLFDIKLETHEVPALALRHDVDACIWQPFAQLINSETWPIKHHGTLMAFGYVQSSKQNKKFVTCSPNFSYSVVCEATRHIFIYKSSANQDCQLRKRTAGVMKNIKIGQQHVVNIDKYGEVLGIHATNDYLFILTETNFVAIGV